MFWGYEYIGKEDTWRQEQVLALFINHHIVYRDMTPLEEG